MVLRLAVFGLDSIGDVLRDDLMTATTKANVT